MYHLFCIVFVLFIYFFVKYQKEKNISSYLVDQLNNKTRKVLELYDEIGELINKKS